MEGKAFQDMPPPGGFGSIKVERVAPKPLLKQFYLGVIIFGMSVYGWNYIREFRRRMFAYQVEDVEHYIAVIPFMDAERERSFLKQLHRMRDYEMELMKNVPGWKLGTLYGEKIYKTLPPDTIPPINLNEYGAHRPESEIPWKILHPDLNQ